ncbi:MAG: hypothetical protein ACO4CT_00230 [Planctomycetota bacterium]|jgi:hypothetical protein
MDKQTDAVTGKFVHRHVSQLKVLARLMEHELDAAKGTAEVAMDRELVESMLDTLEIFIEDVAGGDMGARAAKPAVAEKPAVTRLN